MGYTLDLTVVPERERFSGRVQIQVQVLEPVAEIWLHGQDLDVQEAQIRLARGTLVAARYTQLTGDGVARLVPAHEIEPQVVSLEFVYEASWNRALHGLYRVEDGGEAYAFTQFEPIWARLAFPSFDEPAFKTPFKITLNVDPAHVAVANTPVLDVTRAENGLKRVRFSTTQPLPTYLIALAVGPLDVVYGADVPGNAVRRRPLPFRGLAARGKGGQLAHAMATTGEMLAELEDYFGMPYPFAKLDIIAVPDFAAGAMENAAAIMFRETLLLMNEQPSVRQRRRYAMIMAHELAHQWFGDLVTMPWWDDLWLNEAFATWMAYKTVAAWKPDHKAELSKLPPLFEAVDEDALSSARQIRQPVDTNHEILGAFDTITYNKGGAVLEMFERYLGEQVFRAGIRLYLQRHARGSADVHDFVASLSEAAGTDISEAFGSYLFQAGIPHLEVAPRCEPQASVTIAQSAYRPVGSRGQGEAVWKVPACMRFGGRQQSREQCLLLEDRSATFPLAGDGCPEWLLPNAGFAGYYQWSLPPEWYRPLIARADRLSVPEQISVARSVRAGFLGGRLDLGSALLLARTLADSDLPDVALAPVPMVQFLIDKLLAGTGQQSEARVYAGSLYSRMDSTAALDPDFMAGLDSDSKRLFVIAVAEFKARTVRDARLRNTALRRAATYIAYGDDPQFDTSALAPTAVELALEIAVQENGETFFNVLLRMLATSRDAAFREAAIKALARATDPVLAQRSRALALEPQLRRNEIRTLLTEHVKEPANRQATWQWLQQSLGGLLEKMPPAHAARTPELVQDLCDREQAAEVRELLGPHMQAVPGGPRNLAKAIERIELCAASVARFRSDAVAFFTMPGRWAGVAVELQGSQP